ncbi:hypothetical protein ABEB36_010749 [Hypothenemus hampei]|uniref:Uncharacterized protein n=1 Tax=Hypothenemus hampei TaxID=57062 RepID=A0ABD1EDK5_HYPHA
MWSSVVMLLLTFSVRLSDMTSVNLSFFLCLISAGYALHTYDLELASRDSVPYDLVDNAVILRTLPVIIGALFFLDMEAPKGKTPAPGSVPVKTEAKKSPQLISSDVHSNPITKSCKQMSNDDVEISNKYGIYGKDAIDYVTDTDETASIPAQNKKPARRMHSPVWSNVRKGRRVTITNYCMMKYR